MKEGKGGILGFGILESRGGILKERKIPIPQAEGIFEDELKKAKIDMWIMLSSDPATVSTVTVLGYAYTEEAIKKFAKNHKHCYVFQFKYFK